MALALALLASMQMGCATSRSAQTPKPFLSAIPTHLHKHVGCDEPSKKDRGNGVVTCKGGELEWREAKDLASGRDDLAGTSAKLKAKGRALGGHVEETTPDCYLAGVRGSCRRLVYRGKLAGEYKVMLLGVAQGEGGKGPTMTAACRYDQDGETQMNEVCSELFYLPP